MVKRVKVGESFDELEAHFDSTKSERALIKAKSDAATNWTKNLILIVVTVVLASYFVVAPMIAIWVGENVIETVSALWGATFVIVVALVFFAIGKTGLIQKAFKMLRVYLRNTNGDEHEKDEDD